MMVVGSTNDKQNFATVRLEGSYEEIGFQHGRILKQRIQRVIDFYGSVFNQKEEEVFKKSVYYKKKISDFNSDYCVEIEALAKGAEVHPNWIYALNSRTEILSLDANECTAIYGKKHRILGQNWDWGRSLEDVTTVLEIANADKESRLLMLTEPGIIGKIGMNSWGIGVCLNILRINKKLDGIPVHIVLRAILDSRNIQEAKQWIKKAGCGKSSNLLVGDGDGNVIAVEFAGDESFSLRTNEDYLIHTNHFLKKSINPDAGRHRNSYARLQDALQYAKSAQTLTREQIEKILSDRHNEEFPIFRTYVPHSDVKEIGTIATIIMDLVSKKMYVRKGNSKDHPFEFIGFKGYP